MKTLREFRARFPKLFNAGVLAALLGGTYAAKAYSQDDCCYPGSPCCYPGSPCCKHAHNDQAKPE